LSAFRIVKLCTNLHTFSEAEKANVKNKLIDALIESSSETKQPLVSNGEPILLKCEVTGLYLGVKRFNKQVVVLGNLDNTSCEFIFVLEGQGQGDEVIRLNDKVQIKSLIGGTISLNQGTENSSVEEIIFDQEPEKIENQEQLKINETLEEIYNRTAILKDLELINNFIPTNTCMKLFTLRPLGDFSLKLTKNISSLLKSLVAFQGFLQDWGNISGKVLKSMDKDDREDKQYRYQEEYVYYDYEVDCL
jgi:hypothetical protein